MKHYLQSIKEYLQSIPDEQLNGFIGTIVVIFICGFFVGYAITRNNWDDEEKIN